MKSFVYIFLSWLALNVVFPLILDSFQRAFGQRIDSLLSRIAGFVWFCFRKILQIFFTIFFLPNILVLYVLHEIFQFQRFSPSKNVILFINGLTGGSFLNMYHSKIFFRIILAMYLLPFMHIVYLYIRLWLVY